MGQPDPGATELAALHRRLSGGVRNSLSDARQFGRAKEDAQLLASWPPAKFAPLAGIHDDLWNPRGEPFTMIGALATELGGNRELLNAVIFSPQLALSQLTRLCRAGKHAAFDAWVALCWIAEAAWAAVSGDVPGAPEEVTGDAARLRPVAARLRFLVLSEPMRARGRAEGTIWLADQEEYSGNGALDNVFGLDSWPDLVGRCRDARREWKDCLDAYQSHPLLQRARPAEIEQEVRTLALADGADSRADPLVLRVRPPLAEKAGLTAEDTTVISDCVERHLLPRFAVGLAARLMLYDDRPGWQRARGLLSVAVAGTALAAVGCAAALLVYPAVGLALASYALVGAGIATLPVEWGMMWLLRMPAAAAVGLFALLAFLPSGWLHALPGGWAAAGTLLAVSFGYLLVEVRTHGAGRRYAPPRALLVAFVGAVHALLVTLIGLVLIAPAFEPGSPQLGRLWSSPGYANAGMILTVGTAWCLAVGVFSQILWDERPITAPLAHLSWRRQSSS